MNALNHDLSPRTATAVAAIPGSYRATGSTRGSAYLRYAKRPLDILLVLVGLPVALTVIVVMALAVACRGGQPFYAQTRVGRDGKTFRMWKMRTMVRDADAVMAAHLASDPAARTEWQVNQKLQNDPRITRVGRILRKTSLDELPQIWNVLTGEMSLIGPRPMMVDQECLYHNASYYALRPGITGLWQVSRRNEASFAERAVIDGDYARRLSFEMDLRILVDTLRVVCRGTGV